MIHKNKVNFVRKLHNSKQQFIFLSCLNCFSLSSTLEMNCRGSTFSFTVMLPVLLSANL